MKIKLTELKQIIESIVLEARRKKKTKKKDAASEPEKYKTDENLDFSQPLGDKNLYKRQGASNWGPFTEEKALRIYLRNAISEALRVDEKNGHGLRELVKKLSNGKPQVGKKKKA